MTCSEDMAHKDIRSSEISRGEKDLRSLLTAFHNYIYPFEVEVKKDLFCTYSGARAQAEVANDILNAKTICKAALQNFIQKILVAKTLKLHASLLRQSLNTFGYPEKTKKLN